jgi:regulator of sigma E protease
MVNLLLSSFSEILSGIGYVLLAILILLIMITVHEFGHYIAGKIFGFGIDEFAIGFGPKIFSKTKKNNEVFSIRLLPIGGFCAFRGEDEESSDPTAFNNKPWWQRIIVLISGALMNYLLALLIIILMFSIYGTTALVAYKTTPTTDSIYTIENSFVDRDILIRANGKNIYLTTDLMDAIENKKAGDIVEFIIIRDGQEKTLNLMLREDTSFANVEDNVTLFNALGIYYENDLETNEIKDSGLYLTGIRLGVFQTLGRSFEYSFKLAGSIFTILGQLLTGVLGIKSLGGTVTTISVTATAIQVGGFRNFLNIASFIGVNLAVFNLLPIPALDGCRVIFTLIEGITKKPVNRKVEGIIHMVGLVALLLFAVFVDLQQCF